ncbi:phosphotransferase enzyme family protein [Kitasatospora sp. NPDC057500]|uniref:phosphotransferase enzyme family protein n=1 Tax=Kitasatospora sp. NPDC057500 TaxID=3346151 RepID=UPI003673B8FA
MPSSSSSPSPGEVSAEQITDALAEQYGLHDASVTVIPLGTETDNFAAETERGRLFVKAYPRRAKLDVMAGRITVSELGRSAGSPFPAMHPDLGGRSIARHGEVAASLWDWVDGASLELPYTPVHGEQIGDALGRLHNVLADHPREGFKANTNHWWSHRGDALQDRGRELLALIDAAPEQDADDLARRTEVEERIAQLGSLAELQAGLPQSPREQIVHFDATGANLLWDSRDQLVGVIDIQARIAFPTWELGRAAFEPFTVAESPDWRKSAVAAVTAYAEHVPAEVRPELVYAARMALLHNLTSWFGVDALYGENQLPGRGIYERFWHLRTVAARRMLAELADIEAELADAVGA